MPAPSISSVIDDLIPVPMPMRGVVSRLLGLDSIQQAYAALRARTDERPILERLLERLSITYRLGERDLEQVPRSGPLVVVANHPFGMLEGAVLATVLARVRPDVRFLANEFLSAIPEIRNLLISVDAIGASAHKSRAARRNSTGVRQSIEFLHAGGCLVVFPAGEVSHFQPRERAVTDSEWHTAVARIIETVSRMGVPVSAVPVYIRGSNSLLFQTLGLLHPKLRTALLARELLNKRNRLVELRIGSPIASKKLLEIGTPTQRTEYLRWRTYVLADRRDYKAKTSLPLRNRVRRLSQAVSAATGPALLSAEVESLSPEQLLVKSGELEVYIAPGRAIPCLLQEIGRLRETTFRAAGEGTGKAVDLDRFDLAYLHLFVWNAARHEVVGAYRMAGTDAIRDLYTATLFRYQDAFLDRMGPALELGRSFVRAEYQRGFAPLLALWKGIGAYVSRNPRYRILFGAVSISNQYQAVSRELMVTFLERRASLRGWMELVSHRHPLRRRSPGMPTFPSTGFDIEDLSDVVSDLEPSRAGVPVLLRQYLRLGGKLLGFNVDPEFSDALDGLILVDLTKTEPKLLERYLGKAEAAEFLSCQKGTHGI